MTGELEELDVPSPITFQYKSFEASPYFTTSSNMSLDIDNAKKSRKAKKSLKNAKCAGLIAAPICTILFFYMGKNIYSKGNPLNILGGISGVCVGLLVDVIKFIPFGPFAAALGIKAGIDKINTNGDPDKQQIQNLNIIYIEGMRLLAGLLISLKLESAESIQSKLQAQNIDLLFATTLFYCAFQSTTLKELDIFLPNSQYININRDVPPNLRNFFFQHKEITDTIIKLIKNKTSDECITIFNELLRDIHQNFSCESNTTQSIISANIISTLREMIFFYKLNFLNKHINRPALDK